MLLAGQAELAGVPADAAAERVADDADVRRRAVQCGQAVRRAASTTSMPERAAADPGPARGGVDRHSGHRGRCGAARRRQRPSGPALWPVPCGATRSPAAAAARTTSTTSSAWRGRRQRPGAVDSDVPRHAGSVVAGVAGQVDGTAAEQSEPLGGGGGLGGHKRLLVGYACCARREQSGGAYLRGPWSPLAAISVQVRAGDSAAPSSASVLTPSRLRTSARVRSTTAGVRKSSCAIALAVAPGRREPRDPPLGGRERRRPRRTAAAVRRRPPAARRSRRP